MEIYSREYVSYEICKFLPSPPWIMVSKSHVLQKITNIAFYVEKITNEKKKWNFFLKNLSKLETWLK